MARCCWIASGAVLRPAILWNDGRAFAECREIEERFPALHRVAGNLAFPGFTAPKLLWVRHHEPDIFARTAKVLLPKAYVGYRLTGEMVEEMSDASGTLWLDVGKRDWSDEALAATFMSARAHAAPDRGQPAGRPGSSPISPPAGAWRARLSLPAGPGTMPPVRSGLGAIRPNDAFVSLGTSGVLVGDHRPFRAEPGIQRPRLLPRHSRDLAPDGRHPLRRVRARLVGACRGRGARRSAEAARRRAEGPSTAICSCRTSPASARRTMTRRSAAASWGSTMTPRARR